MGFCKSDQKSMPVVGLLTHNDCDVLRAKTGLYRWVTPRTIIPPTAGGCIVLSIQPYLSSNLVDGCGAPPMVIVSCHLIHCMFEGGLHFVLHLRHLLGKVISSFYSRTPSGL